MTDLNQPYQNCQKENIYGDFDLSSYCNGFLIIIRKIFIFITICVGIYLYILSFIDIYNAFYGGDIIYKNAILAVLISLFCPLWTKSLDDIKADFDDIRKIIDVFIILFLFFCLIFTRSKEKNIILLNIFLLVISGIFLSFFHLMPKQNRFFRNVNNNGSCGDCDPFFCCPRYTIIECDCDCNSDCGNCGDCGDCGDCDECIIF